MYTDSRDEEVKLLKRLWTSQPYRVFITGFSYEHSIFLRLFDIQSLRAVRLLFWVTIILSSCLQIPKASGRLSKMQAGVATFAIFGYSMMYESVSTHIRKILSKIDQAFDELNKMCDHMEKYQKFTYIKHTSPLVRGLQYDNSQSGSSDEKSMAYGFLCSLDENPRFNCLHSHKRLESIKNACKPWDDFLPRLARGFSLLSAYEKSHHESDG